MRDIVFVAVVIAFFLLAALFVRVCEAIVGPMDDQLMDEAGGRMSVENAVGLVLAVLVLGYLIVALIYPERLG